MSGDLQLDEIGPWSEVKLEILKEYASAYSKILASQRSPSLYHVYIDAFAGAGMHLSRSSQEFVLGSPLNALLIQPPFCKYYLIDIESGKVENLRELIGPRKNVDIFRGDCNKILLEDVFPQIKFKDYRRGLCILDPYSLNLEWRVISTAGKMRSLEIFLNFPIMDINRNVLRHSPEKVDATQISRMNAFWGDESWREIAYRPDLFGKPDKQTNEVIVEAFRNRLIKVAGFERVPHPMPMRNSTGAVVYYLFFASPKDTAEHIVLDIFSKYGLRGK